MGTQARAGQDLFHQIVEAEASFVRHAGQGGFGQEQRRGIYVHDDFVEPLAQHHLHAGRAFAAQGLASLGRQAQDRRLASGRQASGNTCGRPARAGRMRCGPRSGSGHLHGAQSLSVKNRHADWSAPEKQRGAHRSHDHGKAKRAVNRADAVLL